MDDVSSLHLMVDTRMYEILMDEGYLCDVAKRKFRELDESGKTIYVLNTFSNEFDDLYHQIPPNARELWSQKKRPLQLDEDTPNQQKHNGPSKNKRLCIAENSVTGVSGGTVTTSNNAGVNNGRMGNKTNDLTIHTTQNFQIFCQATGEERIQSVTLRNGSESSLPNCLKVTIENAKNEKEMVDKLTSNKGTLENGPVLEAETGIGSVIINLTVDKSHIMTDAWVQEILKKIFLDILRDLITEETKLQVTVERYISIGVDEFLTLYSTYHNHEECVAKIEAMKSQLEALALQGESSVMDDETLNQDPLEEMEIDDKLRQESLEEKEIDDKWKQESFEEKEIDDKWKQESFEEKEIDDKSKQGRLEEKEIDEKSLEEKLLQEEQTEVSPAPVDVTQTAPKVKRSKMSASGYDITGCRICESIVADADQLPISETRCLVTHESVSTFSKVLTNDRNGKQLQREAKRQFRLKLKCLLSAIQNSGGGVVLIHLDGLEPNDDYLGSFHEVVDSVLKRIMEDGSLFVNTFKIEWMKRIFQENCKHPHDLYKNVVFIGVSPSNSVITVNFNSYVGSDFSLFDPTSEQIRRYLKTKKKFPSTVPCLRKLENLQKSRNVAVKSSSFIREQKMLLRDDLLLAEHVWKELHLKHYVSAFSKVEGGGSYYLGVAERREMLPTYETRKYHFEGCELTSQRRDGLMAALRKKIETETLVLFFDSEQSPAPLPEEYVEIVFHEVSNLFVLEVAIAAVNGLVFHTKEGPEAYELDDDLQLQRLDLQQWVDRLLL